MVQNFKIIKGVKFNILAYHMCANLLYCTGWKTQDYIYVCMYLCCTVQHIGS